MWLPNQAFPEGIPLGQADGMSVGTLSMALRGFVMKENIRLVTRLVLCNINIGHAVSIAAFR
jgi:hypothetical protein